MGMVIQAYFFEKEELKKFLLLGLMLSLITGINWTLRPLKEALLLDIVGFVFVPRVKIVSALAMLPLIFLYSILVTRLSRFTLFCVLSLFYGLGALAFTWFMLDPTIGLANFTADPSRLLGWYWYIFAESFGLIMGVLFWAFAVDITTADSAKKGFYFIALLGQIGGTFGPSLITRIPRYFDISNAYTVAAAGLLIFLLIPLSLLLKKVIPAEQLVGFPKKDLDEYTDEDNYEPEHTATNWLKFFKGPLYVIGILAIVTFYDSIVMALNYQFKLMVQTNVVDRLAKMHYLIDYAVYTNLLGLLILSFGISALIQRTLGLTLTLMILPLTLLACVLGLYSSQPELLFWLMVIRGGMSFAFYLPAMKQLYIPTTKGIRYKGQAWIESIGSGIAKITPGLLLVSNSYLFFGIIAVWILIVLYLGRAYQKAVDKNRVIC